MPVSDGLSGFSSDQREQYARLVAAPAEDLARLLNDLPDVDLRRVQEMTGAAGRMNYSLRHEVGRAVLRRPHRGAWPTDQADDRP